MQNRFTSQVRLFTDATLLDHPILHGLDDAEAVIDWSELERLMSSIYSARTGRPSYPLLSLFRGLLLGIWYRLSDEQLAQCLFRDLLFRRFCRFELDGSVPDAPTLGRFRTKLMEHDLWERLLGEINRQLEARHIIIAEGRVNIIDATAIEAARSGPRKGQDSEPARDEEAGWHVQYCRKRADSRGRNKATFGFSVHTGVDEDGFIQRQTVTAGNVHDSCERDTLLLGDETALYADPAYSSAQTRQKLARFGIADRVQRKGYRGQPLSDTDKVRNAEIAVIRATGERPFATYKQHYGLARTRFLGLTKNLTFFGIAAIAHNIQKAAKFLRLYGMPEPAPIG